MICDPQKDEGQQSHAVRDEESAELLRRIDRALKTFTVEELKVLVAEIESKMVNPS